MSQPPKQTDLGPGSTLGRYELLLPIAKGGMAQVWAARLRGSRGFQKVVAVKTVLHDVMDNTRMERMFLEEAQLASQIHHPNVVGTLELGEHEGTLYLVMEWVDGEPLNQVMAKAAANGGLPLPIAVNLIGQACQGLYAAHELRDDNGALLGLVHRDVSPQNLLVSFSGTAKLVDFGIAKATARSSGLTEAGEVKGKFAFMAPEQVRGQPVDCRTDLFALGILLYSITTGKHPFRGAHPGETLQNICSERAPTPPSAFLSDYPAALEAVVMKSLAKAPDQRFASANEMLSALEDAMPGPLEASFDVEVSQYLRELFGARASERRAAIRLAQELADRQRSEASWSSVGTLRAISIDRKDSGSFTLNTASTGPLTTLPSQPDGVQAGRARASRKVAALAIGCGLALSGGAFLLSGAPSPAASATAASPVPSGVSLQAALRPPVAPPAAASEPAVEALPPLENTEKSPRKLARAARVAPAPAKAPVVAAPAAAPATSTTIAPSVAQGPPAASASAWDRGAFGGRH
jgi:eukaryotic-like serine/threonine-protein kinase